MRKTLTLNGALSTISGALGQNKQPLLEAYCGLDIEKIQKNAYWFHQNASSESDQSTKSVYAKNRNIAPGSLSDTENQMNQHIASYLPDSGGIVFEVGSWRELFLENLHTIKPYSTMIASDYIPEIVADLEQKRNKKNNLYVIPYDIGTSGILGSIFDGSNLDAIIAKQVFQNISAHEVSRFLRESWNVLRPGGIVAFTLEHGPKYGSFRKQTLWGHPTSGEGRLTWIHNTDEILLHSGQNRNIKKNELVEFFPGDKQRVIIIQKSIK